MNSKASSRSKQKLNVKEIVFIKGLVAGKYAQHAAMETGVFKNLSSANNGAIRMLQKDYIKDALAIALEKHGITVDKVVEPVANALNAKVRIKSVIDGSTTEIDAPDLEMQLKGHDRAAKLLGLNQQDKTSSITNNFNFGEKSESKEFIDVD